ncbi:KamA family radical SAM protein [Ancylomarina longa]|uniref:4Fe-4S cluster-binding domain-containing protein n=1 Tax=Ancylomarina longa TaxID=2487017 RepID=A0A434AWJ1_9BACT|nr:4Fe-4S cluster-binding domain-containing protein [Ancylomarina longa]RUT78770.1 4Fe-4S cluster-binding domain-containing protein [Ancylomarina longa]
MKYRAFTLSNFKNIPQIKHLSEEQIFDIEVVGEVLPFKTNNYVIEELIDWAHFETDPIYILTFPQKDMLSNKHYDRMAELIRNGASKSERLETANQIRMELNPNPAGQEHNVPEICGEKLVGLQHKYNETVLFFPSQGQSCHAFCTFCFRWSQFSGISELKFAMKQVDLIIDYIRENPQITDLLITGGDPMIMKTKVFEQYIDALLAADLPNLKTIRIGTKTLGYWPYRYTTDEDASQLLDVFKKIVNKGINLAIMAHFNHINEMSTITAEQAIKKIQATGAIIRTQTPLLKHLNDDADMLARMWRKQVNLGLIPYYLFVARETGAQEYFALNLEEAYNIYRNAYIQVSGICRTVRGPVMSAHPGKVQVAGISEINGEKVFVLNFIQARNTDWVGKPFYAKYNPDALWVNDLEPAFEDKFIFEA